MKRKKVSELEGEELDYFVALGENRKPTKQWVDDKTVSVEGCDIYSPSRYWAQGEPLIERERIAVVYAGRWSATKGRIRTAGDTALIAAMRCFVASKFGEEVELP